MLPLYTTGTAVGSYGSGWLVEATVLKVNLEEIRQGQLSPDVPRAIAGQSTEKRGHDPAMADHKRPLRQREPLVDPIERGTEAPRGTMRRLGAEHGTVGTLEMSFHGRAGLGGFIDEWNRVPALLMEAVDNVTLQTEPNRNDIARFARLPLDAGHHEIRRERANPFHKIGRLRLTFVCKCPGPRWLVRNQDRPCVTNEHDMPVHETSFHPGSPSLTAPDRDNRQC